MIADDNRSVIGRASVRKDGRRRGLSEDEVKRALSVFGKLGGAWVRGEPKRQAGLKRWQGRTMAERRAQAAKMVEGRWRQQRVKRLMRLMRAVSVAAAMAIEQGM